MSTIRSTIGMTLRRSIRRALVETGKDIDLERQRQAIASTAHFVDEHLSAVKGHRGENATEAMFSVLREALRLAPRDGLFLEFGVATGRTMREIAAYHLPAFGFDSFQGLPENWRQGYEQGAFAQELPEVGGAELLVGWFDETLPKFLNEHPEPFAFVHLDADLYSSTKTVFDLGFDRFVPGTVIMFDEFFNYPGWEQHEHRAFMEFVGRYSGSFEWVNYNALHEQVTVRLTD